MNTCFRAVLHLRFTLSCAQLWWQCVLIKFRDTCNNYHEVQMTLVKNSQDNVRKKASVFFNEAIKLQLWCRNFGYALKRPLKAELAALRYRFPNKRQCTAQLHHKQDRHTEHHTDLLSPVCLGRINRCFDSDLNRKQKTEMITTMHKQWIFKCSLHQFGLKNRTNIL